jgi:hypothetical protein
MKAKLLIITAALVAQGAVTVGQTPSPPGQPDRSNPAVNPRAGDPGPTNPAPQPGTIGQGPVDKQIVPPNTQPDDPAKPVPPANPPTRDR